MAENNPIRLGMVGIGRAGWGMHCPELKGREDKFQIVAACDEIPERCGKMAERYGCKTYEKIKDLIADPNVEIVDIATRSCDHFAHAKMALEAGKDVFLEKPITLDYDQASKLKVIAEKAKGNLYIRHNRRFEPAFQHIKEIIASGILGEVYEVKLRRVSYGRRDDWQTIIEFGGGQLLNWGPHIIDHGLRFLESPLKSVWADLKLVAAVGDAEDHLKVILTGENGRIVDLEISGGAAVGEPEYIIWGNRGGLSCDGRNITLRYLDPNEPLSERHADPETPGKETGRKLGDNVPSFGNPDVLHWISETIPVAPEKQMNTDTVWDELYGTYREGTEYPIKLEEAVDVMKVVSLAKKGTRFETK